MGKQLGDASDSTGPQGARVRARRGLIEQEIYDQATRLFAQRGFAGTSFQDIADAVGLTRPALYHYVRSKDELLAKLVKEITEQPAAELSAIAGRGDLVPTEKLRELVLLAVRHQGEHAERFRLLVRSEADLPADVAAAYEAGRRLVLRSLTTVIEDGVARGDFRPVSPTVAALGVLGMANWVAWWYRPDYRFELDQVCDELAALAVAGLAGGEGRGATFTPLDVVRGIRGDLDRLERLLGD
jgi:AcrR family transcriptional regulator